MSLKKSEVSPIGANSLIYLSMELDPESIYTIIYDPDLECDIGSRVSDSTTELFAMDDDTREGHRELKDNN